MASPRCDSARTAALDSRTNPHEPHAQDRSHPFDHGGRQVERRYRRERRCLVDLTTDLHVETSTVEKGCEIVAVLERRSIELTLRDPRDGLPEADPLGWQVPNLRLEREIRNNPPAACELAEQAMNVPGETSCLLSRKIADEPFAQNHQRSTTVETRGGDLQLAEIEHVGSRHRVQRARREFVPPSNVFEEIELRRHDIAQICLDVVKRVSLREIESPKRVSTGQLENLRGAAL